MSGCVLPPTDAVSTAPTPNAGGASVATALLTVIAEAADAADGRNAESPPKDALSGYEPDVESLGSCSVTLPAALVVPIRAAPPAAMVTSLLASGDPPAE